MIGMMAASVGCPPTPPHEPAGLKIEPTSLQMMKYEPDLKSLRFTTILNFELSTERVFVVCDGGVARTSEAGAHSGKSSLLLPLNTRKARIDIARMLASRPFPGQWALAGLYFHLPSAGMVRISYEVDGTTIAQREVQSSGGWTAAFVDIARYYDPPPAGAGGLPPKRSSDPGSLVLELPEVIQGRIFLDDVMLIDNTRILIDRADSTVPDDGHWRIRQRGFAYDLDAMPVFRATLIGAEADPAGWILRETTALRAVAVSRSGQTWAIYPDGRRYDNSRFSPLAKSSHDAAYAAQHASPARIEVTEETGKIVRNTSGDANNDGYNEQTGAYQIAAASHRVEFRIIPQTPSQLRTMLEIGNLPEGRVLATMEGTLLTRTARLPDGRVLIEIPQSISRPVMVQVRMQ